MLDTQKHKIDIPSSWSLPKTLCKWLTGLIKVAEFEINHKKVVKGISTVGDRATKSRRPRHGSGGSGYKYTFTSSMLDSHCLLEPRSLEGLMSIWPSRGGWSSCSSPCSGQSSLEVRKGSQQVCTHPNTLPCHCPSFLTFSSMIAQGTTDCAELIS